MRWPLRNQLLLPFTLVIGIAVVTVSGVDAYLAARRFERQIDAQLARMAETLRDATFPLTDPVLAQIRGLSGVEIVALDAAGRVTNSSLPKEMRRDFARPTTDAPPPGPIIDLAGDRYFVRTVAERRAVGDEQLHLLYPERTYRETRRAAALPSLVVGAVALGFVVAAASLVAHQLSRPIGRLGEQVSRIADGDYEPLPLPARDDELRDLSASVNRLATRLAELTAGLRRSERLALLGQLSGGIAHQLRNSIAGAKIAVQLHRRECSGDDPRTLEVALRQLTLVEEQVRSFLTAGDDRPPRRVSCDLRAVAADAVSLVEPMARHRQVALRQSLPATPLIALVDPSQLRELLLNLLLNAIDAANAVAAAPQKAPGVESAADAGWVEVAVREEPTETAPRLLLEVSDSGPGPAAAVRDQMFEPFVTGKPEGIGLGLAAARRIAAAHGGRLEFVDAPVTCFRVELPADVADPVASPHSPSPVDQSVLVVPAPRPVEPLKRNA